MDVRGDIGDELDGFLSNVISVESNLSNFTEKIYRRVSENTQASTSDSHAYTPTRDSKGEVILEK